MAKPISKSELRAAASLAADMAEWVTYMAGETQEPLDFWLESNRPSQVSQDDGVGWVCVQSAQNAANMDVDDESDPRGLQQSFEALRKSGNEISFKAICELAQQHHVLAGKWMLFSQTGLKIDHLWSLVATATAAGNLGTCAKVSVVGGLDNGNHVVCMYVDDFTNEEEVQELEAAIRRAGIRVALSFKPDVYTWVGVYSGNEWGLRPVIYESHYSIQKGTSHITKLKERY